MDAALAPFSLLVDALTVADEPMVNPLPGLAPEGYAEGLYVERLQMALPFEIQVDVDDAGHVRVAGAPPTQTIRTTIMPVLHSMTLHVVGRRSDG